MRPKGKTSVKKAALQAYEVMPEKFSSLYLARVARLIYGRRFTFHDTIMRKLREYRTEGVINFKCIHNKKSLYKKL